MQGPAEGITEYGRIKVGTKTLDDAVLNLGSIRKANLHFGDKNFVLRAMALRDIPQLREISNYFYLTSGIYMKACNYLANLYRYDWYLSPEIYDDSVSETKVIKDFQKILNFMDDSYIKKICGDIALGVVRDGAYYGYLITTGEKILLQELPVSYCRSRFTVNGLPAIEFNMRFFDDKFPDITQRLKILKMFPAEFAKGYTLYKQGKLPQEGLGDRWLNSWYLLEPGLAVKFNLNNSDIPCLINAIPAILDLDAAQDLDRQKQMQRLLKIIIQKLPLDKNSDLVFDVEEARDIHNNAVDMLRRAIGVDVLTTFAEVDSINMSDSTTVNSVDDLEKNERTVYNALGISQNLFNTDGNVALEKSILTDESSMRTLLLQFNLFYNQVISKINKSNKKRYNFRFYMLETTQYNYKELAKLYKEQTQIGFSKMLPQIALGHSQSFILNSISFENEILNLHEIMIPPLMSSTMSSTDVLGNREQSKSSQTQESTETNTGGRPSKSDDEKSEKTLQNKESQS